MQAIAPPAVFDPQDLQRVTSAGWPGKTVAEEIAQAKGGPVTHAATRAYELKDAVLARGHIFTSKAFVPIKPESPPLLVSSPEHHYENAALASTWIGSRYFGHWLIDDLPMALAAAKLARPISLLTNPSTGQRQYLDALGLDLDCCDSALIDRLVIIDDIGQNNDKRARYEKLRGTIFGKYPRREGSKVMLLRGNTGVRRILVNEMKLAERLARSGFTILDPLKISVDEILDKCVGAKLVVGVEGSQLLNGAFWMAEGGAVITIQPPDRFQMLIKVFCDCAGIAYGFVVGEKAGQDFSVDIGAVERLIDRVSA